MSPHEREYMLASTVAAAILLVMIVVNRAKRHRAQEPFVWQEAAAMIFVVGLIASGVYELMSR